MSKISRKIKSSEQHDLWENDQQKHFSKDDKHKDLQISYYQNSLKVIIIYQLIYMSGIAYALYKFFLLSQKWKRSLEITENSSVFGSHQDQNDLEWKIFIPIIIDSTPYLILHLVLAQFIRYSYPELLRPFYISFGTVMLLKIIGPLGASLCYLIPAVMFVVLFSRLRYLIWLAWCFMLIIFNCKFFQDFLESYMNDNGEGEYKTSVIVAWIMLRCVSFCLITCTEDPLRTQPSSLHLLDILSYSFYFPNLVTGPYVPYKDYKEGVTNPFTSWTLEKLTWFVVQIARFGLWMFLADTLLYYFYAHSLIFNSSYIENFGSWTMAGYYSFVLIFFFLKYVVMYGLPSVFARAEGFRTPDPPHCVLQVRRYSDIWRYFDSGLHRFIIDHIYIPFLGDEATIFKQVQGSVVAFTFIYVWHGAYPSVLWWCVLNFGITMIEKVGDRFAHSSFYNEWEENYLPGKWGKAFRLFSTGVFLSLSMNSLIIFLTSVEHAWHVFQNIFIKGFPTTTLTTVFFFSLMGEGGNDFLHYRLQRKTKKI